MLDLGDYMLEGPWSWHRHHHHLCTVGIHINPTGFAATNHAFARSSFSPALPITPTTNFLLPAKSTRRKKFKQVIPFGIAFILVLAIIGIWFTSPSTAPSVASPGVTQQNFGTSATATNNTSSTSSGSIRVYIVGAVKNPGVYTLDINARVYDLLQAAGGPQAKADLVALNLAAKLTDGEEVYVTLVGEVPPTYMGGVPGPGPASGRPPQVAPRPQVSL